VTTLSESDIAALEACLQHVMDTEPEYREQIQRTLEGEGFCKGWGAAALFCCTRLQRRALGIRPWMRAPADGDTPWPGGEGGPEIIAARQKLLRDLAARGISRYVADPIAALAKAKVPA
jgi:hypothetical protein